MQRGLLALQGLLWVLGLPAALPCAGMALVYRWQLRCTLLMWQAMRGKQRLPLLRVKLLQALRLGSTAGGNVSSDASGQPRAGAVFEYSGGTSLKQLSGSMLLFMPLLLLLPTTGWYYGFVLALYAACCLPRVAVRLALQLVRHSPVLAAARQLLGADSSTAEQYDYQMLEPTFDQADMPQAAREAMQRTTYLLARRRHGSCCHAAAQAAVAAWHACSFTSPAAVVGAVLAGRPLWLAPPGWVM